MQAFHALDCPLVNIQTHQLHHGDACAQNVACDEVAKAVLFLAAMATVFTHAREDEQARGDREGPRNVRRGIVSTRLRRPNPEHCVRCRDVGLSRAATRTACQWRLPSIAPLAASQHAAEWPRPEAPFARDNDASGALDGAGRASSCTQKLPLDRDVADYRSGRVQARCVGLRLLAGSAPHAACCYGLDALAAIGGAQRSGPARDRDDDRLRLCQWEILCAATGATSHVARRTHRCRMRTVPLAAATPRHMPACCDAARGAIRALQCIAKRSGCQGPQPHPTVARSEASAQNVARPAW
jgi:hypothetical protein